MEKVGGSLALIGAVGVIAALVGGNVRLPGARFAAINSPAIRWTLGVACTAFLAAGMMMMTATFPTKGGSAAPGPLSPTSVPTSAAPVTDEKTPPAPTSVPAPSQEPAPNLEAAYRKDADAICAKVRQRMSGITVPSQDDLQGNAAFARVSQEVLRLAASDLAAIKAPATLKSKHESMVRDISNMSSGFGDVGYAYENGDDILYGQTAPKIMAFDKAVKQLATELGLEECADM
jgi:hypothetical protein